MNLKSSTRYVAVVAAVCLLCVGMSGCASISSGGYQFQSGQTHPPQISNLLKNGSTVLLFITKNNCPDCEAMKPKIADLQSQLNGTNFTLQGTGVTTPSTNATKQSNLTFIRVDVDDNLQSYNIGAQYGATTLPTIVVIRPDGAVAVFKGPTDENLLKSAIADAQK
jgi:thiol-disulfide isomerase/thioredoxin